MRSVIESTGPHQVDIAPGSHGSLALVCAGPDVAHRPTQKSAKRGGRKYFLFAAAQGGCVECVRRLVLEEGVDPESTSTTCKYTARSFAEYGLQQGLNERGCRDVIRFLDGGIGFLSPEASVDTDSAPPPPPLGRPDADRGSPAPPPPPEPIAETSCHSAGNKITGKYK